MLGWNDVSPCRAIDVWKHVVDRLGSVGGDAAESAALDTILKRGPLARRLVTALGQTPTRVDLGRVYQELCDCLANGRLFDPGARSA